MKLQSLLGGCLAALHLLAMASVAEAEHRGVQVGSTWPLAHSDARNSDWLPLAGPRELVPKWFALEDKPNAAVAAIGPEGNVYSVTMDAGPCHLHAFDSQGNPLWCSAEVRTAYAEPAIDPANGAVFINDGTELFRFESDGSLTWRSPAPFRALGLGFTREGFLLIIDADAVVNAYDPATGAQIAGPLFLPSGALPRPPSAPLSALVGLPLIGMDPDPEFVNFFFDAFLGFNFANGNNNPSVHQASGRIFIALIADPTAMNGIFYGIDFTPPHAGGAGAFEIACQVPLGLNSGTSPAISADGNHVYAGDADGILFAFKTSDCGVAWSLDLGGSSLSSPTVGLDGMLYSTAGASRILGFRDNGGSGEQLWEADLNALALAEGFAAGRVNSVAAISQTYLYVAASFDAASGFPGVTIPARHVIVTIDPADGAIVSLAELGDESDSILSLGPDGSLYAPSKTLVKAVLLGTPLAPLVPEPAAGLYAFEPASYRELTLDGLSVGLDFSGRGQTSLGASAPEAAAVEINRALRQISALRGNLREARDRSEVSGWAAWRANRRIARAERLYSFARYLLAEFPPPLSEPLATILLRAGDRKLEQAIGVILGPQ